MKPQRMRKLRRMIRADHGKHVALLSWERDAVRITQADRSRRTAIMIGTPGQQPTIAYVTDARLRELRDFATSILGDK